MSYQDVVAEIPRLTVQERLALIAALTRSVQTELATTGQGVDERAHLIETLNARGSTLERVLGMARPDGPAPTDDEVRDLIAVYLIEKHS